MIDEPIFTIADVSLFTRKSKTTLRKYITDGQITPTTVMMNGTRMWSISDLLYVYMTIYQIPASADYVASFLFDKGYKDETTVSVILTKLRIRELVGSWS